MRFLRLISFLVVLLMTGPLLHAQFKQDAFSQNYADSTDKEAADSSKLFNFKEYFGGLSHQRSASLKTLFMGSTIFVGGQQIYNKDYWKLPITYGGIGAGVGLGIYFNQRYKTTEDPAFKTASTWSFIAAGAVYWGTLMDGVACYPSNLKHDPARATLYSLLLPGLGQVYNGEAWKVPIYWSLIAGAVYFLDYNHTNYIRYKNIYNQATSEDPDVEKPPVTAEAAKYYRDANRRLRDYCILFTAGFYLLQVIDANVFAYMQDFEISDDISLRVEPAVIPVNHYAFAPPALGVGVSLKF